MQRMYRITLTKSRPPGWGHLSAKDRALFERLPADYREFLERNNGGFVEPGSSSHFSVAMERRSGAVIINTSSQNRIEEFFAVMPSDAVYTRQDGAAPASLFHEHWNRHIEEAFLPIDVVVIARCEQSCLLACSLNPEDYGAIYYWEWYWYYPWFAKFFDDRIEAAERKYPDIEKIRKDSTHPLYRDAFNAFNYATLVKVANSFSALIDSLKPEDAADA
jgi:hypothetical protein